MMIASYYYISLLIEYFAIVGIIYISLDAIWKTRSFDLLVGFSFVLLFCFILSKLELMALHYFVEQILHNIVIIAAVIFQKELRELLSRIFSRFSWLRIYKDEDVQIVNNVIDSISECVKRKWGAFLVFEQDDSLDAYMKNGIEINSSFSSPLLISLLNKTSPLHDGGIVIRRDVICAASVIFPLREIRQESKGMGARQHVALEVSGYTDAFIIIVSEETGNIYFVREGELSNPVNIEDLRDQFTGYLSMYI